VVGVERWAELRREHFVRGVSIKELVRRTGLSRNTIRAALRSPSPPRYVRAPAGSNLDPFKGEIHVLLRGDPRLPGQRIRELIAICGSPGRRFWSVTARRGGHGSSSRALATRALAPAR
jgi:hypothetical protein